MIMCTHGIGAGRAWNLSFQGCLGRCHVLTSSAGRTAVFSHETALFFHDLTDREPLEYTVTVKTGYNPSKLKAEGVQVFTIKAELHGVA